ncbi:MAG: aspartate/glutamate racemase family protein [Gammaproteobacteria bacterium]|nr:aspartate/glutamate racemase family protein [Gammaproteobacteria bacterium]
MKKIGLIGGMSWESTAIYYKVINQEVSKRLGKLHSARLVVDSVDFEEIEIYQREGRWDDSAQVLIQSAKDLQAAGADFAMICTNTMHKVYQQVADSISIPLVHIADAAGIRLLEEEIQTIGLLGTKYTMREDFYKQRLIDKFKINVIVPEENDQELINQVIYNELCLGNVRADSKEYYLQVSNQLAEQGAQAILLGCTEIGMLVKPEDLVLPVFDTALLHAHYAVDLALEN